MRIYPAAWRDRYGVEFQALFDQMKPGWRDILNVLNGGLQMRLRRAQLALTVAAFGVLGALAAGALAAAASDRFASTGSMTVRPASAQTGSGSEREDVVIGLARAAFSRDFLTDVIYRHNLYAGERAQTPTEDLVDRVRGDIRIERVSRSIVLVSFVSPEARLAQPVTNDVLGQLVTANLTTGQGSVVQIIDRPDEPKAFARPQRVATAGLGGLSGGALIGMMLGILPRRRSPLGS
jgi:hypothetical protein